MSKPIVKQMKLKMTFYRVVIILISCVGLSAGQSTLITPSLSIPQTVAVSNHTETVQASIASMTIQSTYPTIVQNPSVKPSITINHHSSVPSTSLTTTNNDEGDKEETAKNKKQTAIIAASCSGGAVLIIGLALIICTHRKNHDTSVPASSQLQTH